MATTIAYRRLVCAVAVAGVVCGVRGPTRAQHAFEHLPAVSGMPQGVPLLCADTTVTSAASGSWFDPATWSTRAVPGSQSRVAIAAGHAVIYDGSSDAAVGCVEVRGQLVFSTSRPTRLKVATLMVLEEGSLEVGRPESPVGADHTAEIIIADQPLDTVRDPAQLGTALIALGRVRMHGAEKKPTFVRARSEPLAGTTALELEAAVDGWKPGDELVISDTRQLRADERGLRYRSQAERLRIASTSGQMITVTAPLAHNHKGARDASGRVDFVPHVGHVTRNVIVRSESPTGTRGHVMFISRADVDVRYTEFRDLGRTTTAGLDNTQFGTEGRALRVGKNQIGRYAVHFHHTFGPKTPQPNGHQFTVIGNVVNGAAKWGITVHRSHYGLIQDNVVLNTRGAGIVTEDGSESFNVFEHNLSMQSAARRVPVADSGYGGGVEVGGEGAGFWFRGPNNYVRRNVAAGGEQRGFSLPVAALGIVRVPAFKGADTSKAAEAVQVDMTQTPLLEFSNNEAYGAMDTGLMSVWNGTIAGLTIWHASHLGLSAAPPESLVVEGLTVRGDASVLVGAGEKPIGVWVSNYLSKTITLTAADVQGMRVGVHSPFFYDQTPKDGRGAGSLAIENGYFRNQIGISVATAYRAAAGGVPVKRAVVRRSVFGPLAVPGSDPATSSTAISMNYEMTPRDARPRDPLLVVEFNKQPGKDFKVYYSHQAPEESAPCHETAPEIDGWVCK